MEKLICMAICVVYLFTGTVCMAYEAECINTDGKFSNCTVEVNDGALTVTYGGKKWQKLDKTIVGDQITALSGGEYARRRVGESIGSAVLLGPLFLFMLFSKKKRDNYGIEYMMTDGNRDAVMVQLKKKYGFAFGQQLKTISGKDIQMEGAVSDNQKQAEAPKSQQGMAPEISQAAQESAEQKDAKVEVRQAGSVEVANQGSPDGLIQEATANEKQAPKRKHR